MKTKTIKGTLGALLALLLLGALLPGTAMAAGPSVGVGSTTLNETTPSYTAAAGGTVTLDQTNRTLTLDNVVLSDTETINIVGDGQPFTVILKGDNSIGSEHDPTYTWSVPLLCQNADLELRFEEGATLTAYSQDNYTIWNYTSGLTLSGNGKLTGVCGSIYSSEYAVLSAQGNINVRDTEVEVNSTGYGVVSFGGDVALTDTVVTVSSDNMGIYGANGVVLDCADVTVNAGGYGVYSDGNATGISVTGGSLDATSSGYGLWSYRDVSIAGADVTVNAGSGNNYGIYVKNGGITMAGSEVGITSDSVIGAYCQYHPITVDNTRLTTRVPNGYSLYSIYGDIVIQGADTFLDGQDAAGLYAVVDSNSGTGGHLSISGGRVELISDEGCLCADTGIDITGGVVDLTTGDFAAIMSQAGELSITGADTFVTAVNSSADYAAIANHSDGGLYLAARISATNNGGGKPFEGATADGAQAITLGAGYEAYPQSGLTTEAGHTYFVDAEGVPAAGRLDVCSHRWDNPEFTWAPDGKSCSVTLTCAVDDSHTITLNSADQPGSIEYQVTTPATCTDMGTTTYTATLALDEDHVYTDSLAVVDVPAVGHQPVKTEAREASCTAEGNTAYWRCSVCGKYFSDEACTQEIAPADTVVAAAGHQPVKVEAKAPTAEAVGNCEYWYCRNCGKYFSNEACTQEITLADTVVAKLPKIIAGADQSWTKGGRDGLTVTSNGAFADFLNVQVDGRVVDSANYEAEEGSTVVTLKPAYLEGLRVGSHTLGVASRNGTATTTFTIVAQSASAPGAPSPQTGDSSLIALGAVSLALASCGLLGILLWSRRKRKD